MLFVKANSRFFRAKFSRSLHEEASDVRRSQVELEWCGSRERRIFNPAINLLVGKGDAGLAHGGTVPDFWGGLYVVVQAGGVVEVKLG